MLTDRRLVTGLSLSGIVLAGAALRLWNLGEASLWLDEAASVQFAGLPWSTLWLTGYDNGPPVYYSLLKLTLLFSDSEFAIRLPSALFGILTIPVVYWAGRLIAGPWAGLAAALYLALSATQIEYSQEARGYSLLIFALAIALVGLVQVFQPDSPEAQATGSTSKNRHGVGGLSLYAFGILIALYTNNIAVFFVFVAQLAFVYHWMTQGARAPFLAIRWLLANGIIFLLWVPWLHIILTELLGNGTMDHLHHITAGRALEHWRAVHGFTFVWRAQPWLDLTLGLLCLFGAFRLHRQPAVLLALLFVAALGPFLMWLIGFSHPVFMERTLTWSFLGTTLLVGVGVEALKGWKGLMIMLFLTVVSARSVMSFYELGETENEDWRAAFAPWQQAVAVSAPGQAALFCSPTVAIAMLYYARHETALPPLLAWGSVPGGAGTALMLDRAAVTGDFSLPDWLQEIPHDLFLWKRGAVDERRRHLPALPDEARWRQAVWRRLEVIESHCPDDSRAALEAALADARWGLRLSSDFKGGSFASYACQMEGCFLPGQGKWAAARSAPRDQK